MQHEQSFLNAVRRDVGNAPDYIETTDKIHRFPTKANGRDDAGWCVFYVDGDFAGGAYGDWREGSTYVWNSANCTPEIKKTIATKSKKSIADSKRVANKAARERLAKTKFPPLRPIDYITKKQIDINDEHIKAIAGCHPTREELFIFMHDKDGVRQSVQTIYPDKKRFMKGVSTDSLHTILGPVTPTIYICEGFATSCAVYQATRAMTVCAFASGNVLAVTRIIAAHCPSATIIIATDNDQAGEDAARKAAQEASNLQSLPPEIGQDWNDYYVEHGPAATAAEIEARVSEVAQMSMGKPDSEEKPKPKEDSSPISSPREMIRPIQLAPKPVPWTRTGLPDVIADTAEAASRVTGSDPHLFSSPAIAVLCSVIHDSTKVSLKRKEDFKQRACIWATTLAPSGAGKSPMAAKALQPLKDIEEELAPIVSDIAESYRIAAKQRANTIREIEKGEEIPTPPPLDPMEYQQPRLVCQDVTTEGITKIQSVWNGGSVIIADELASLVGGFDRYSNGNRDESFFLTAYDGGSYTVDRKMEGHTRIQNLSVGIIAGIQPVVAAGMFAGTGSNGFIERHLLAVAGLRNQEDEDASDIEELRRWSLAVQQCYQRGNEKKLLTLSDGADRVRRELNQWVYKYGRSGFEGLNSHLNKFPALFGRLIIPWHFLTDESFDRDTVISEETAQLVFDYLTGNHYHHACSAYAYFAEARDYSQELIKMTRAILEHPEETITLPELRSVTPMSKGKLAEVISFLESRNYLIPDAPGQWAVVKF